METGMVYHNNFWPLFQDGLFASLLPSCGVQDQHGKQAFCVAEDGYFVAKSLLRNIFVIKLETKSISL